MDALHRTDPLGPRAWKSGPKQYKGVAGPTGRARIERSARSLILQAHRFAKRPDTSIDDAQWASDLGVMLRCALSLPDA